MSNQEYSSSSYLPDSRYQADASVSNPFPIKSVLKRSKSFGNGTQESMSRTTTPEHFNYDQLDENDDSSTQKILERVRTIFLQVLESQESTQKLANYCCKIYKNRLNVIYFFDSLLCCAREWILERNRLKTDKWTRLVHFLSHLYQDLQTPDNNAEPEVSSKSSSSGSDNEELVEVFQNASIWGNKEFASQSSALNGEEDKVNRIRQIKVLSGLLLDCVLFSINNPGNEQELAASVLRCFGESLEKMNPSKMRQIVNCMRNQLLESRNDQKVLLEMIELSASDWQFEDEQDIYYFPFTKF